MDFDKLLMPFWEGDEVFAETVMLLSEGGEKPKARLFYKPEKILSVTSADFKTEYKEGLDWKYINGEIVMADGASMPFMKKEDCHFYEKIHEDCFGAKDGGYILYKTKGFFHKRQIAVSYLHKDRAYFGIEKLGGKKLERTRGLLEAGKEINVCFYGDSITAGCDGSKLIGIEPFMPGWQEMFCKGLEGRFNCRIKSTNTAVGGKQSDWGLECADERLASYKPDLAIIAFGMNDGTEHVPPAVFRRNIEGIKEKALARNKHAEFIFIATTLPNPESVFDGYQRQYYDELVLCARENDAVLNMTKIHSVLLERKEFIDMTGNNINHPNDFLIRIYAQALLALFIK